MSDFHWPLDRLGAVLDLLAPAHVVPMILWDPAETEPPARDGLALLQDAESHARRTFWIRAKFRDGWRKAVHDGIVPATRHSTEHDPTLIRLPVTNDAEAFRILEGAGKRALTDMDAAVQQAEQLAKDAA